MAYAGVPLRLTSGHNLGAFCVASLETRSWTEDEIGLHADLAATAVAQIEVRISTLADHDPLTGPPQPPPIRRGLHRFTA